MLTKKTLAIVLGSLLLGSTATAADIKVGLDAWNTNLNLEGEYLGFKNSFDTEHKYKPVVWAQIEHSIPVVPNIKVRYTDLDRDSSSLINGSIKIDDVIFTDQDLVHTDLKLSHFDIITYYNLISSSDFKLGLGLDFKIGDFKLSAWDDYVSESESYNGVIPLPYASLNWKLPLNLSIRGDCAGLKLKDYTFYDAEAALSWEAFSTTAIGASIEAGYRKIYASADDVKDLNVHIKSDGFFAGVVLTY